MAPFVHVINKFVMNECPNVELFMFSFAQNSLLFFFFFPKTHKNQKRLVQLLFALFCFERKREKQIPGKIKRGRTPTKPIWNKQTFGSGMCYIYLFNIYFFCATPRFICKHVVLIILFYYINCNLENGNVVPFVGVVLGHTGIICQWRRI